MTFFEWRRVGELQARLHLCSYECFPPLTSSTKQEKILYKQRPHMMISWLIFGEYLISLYWKWYCLMLLHLQQHVMCVLRALRLLSVGLGKTYMWNNFVSLSIMQVVIASPQPLICNDCFPTLNLDHICRWPKRYLRWILSSPKVDSSDISHIQRRAWSWFNEPPKRRLKTKKKIMLNLCGRW